ncbi:HAMP domain-containing histidine kinase [Kitasatospora acidiphila]|uniref:histidine kinase n=1 Tax=Kitasatospora acidiphila TaxID=2567942 RepID=A0A540WFC2_9ACTN|nr:HAMP domain-containing sensor histidine kinase [Kitasatospora acidiphila]TQF07597.1 HAMP domain-containing histidine kinase [Kitasatospora acidiphila]
MRRALVKAAVAGTTMVALAFLIPLGLTVQQTARDRAFTNADKQAAALGPALAITTDRDDLARALASTDAGARGKVAIHLPPDAGATAPGATVGTGRAGAPEVAAAALGRVLTVPVPGGYARLQPVAVNPARVAVVEVYVAESDLTRGVGTAWLVLSLVALGLVALAVLVADRMGGRIVGSARRLAAAARALGAGDLAVRVPETGPEADGSPAELRDAATAFNTMADRVAHLLAAERELAADLSHRLRTPLTVLRLNAAALGDGDAADATRHAVAQLEREVDQIIRSARRPVTEAPAGPVGCDAAEVIRERVGFWSALAEDEGRPWGLHGAEAPAQVPVPRGDLAAAVDALLGNVFRHTAVGTAFAVDVLATEHAVIVLVGDAGPGFDDPSAALRRGEGHGGEGSTGLGLDIVRKLAAVTGGDLALGRSAGLGGAEIRLRLGVDAAPPAPAARRLGRARRRRDGIA